MKWWWKKNEEGSERGYIYGGQAKKDFASPNGEKHINRSEQIFTIHFLEIKHLWIYINTYHLPGERESGKTTQL